MIVRLTKHQHANLIHLVGDGPHRRWLDDTHEVAKTLVEVAMPPIGWRTLREICVSEAFTPRGFKSKGRQIVGTALRRIAMAEAHLEAHPAFKGLALVGAHYDSFLAWGSSPYPDPVLDADLLYPYRRYASGLLVTEWRRQPVVNGASGLLDPAEHWVFRLRPRLTR